MKFILNTSSYYKNVDKDSKELNEYFVIKKRDPKVTWRKTSLRFITYIK